MIKFLLILITALLLIAGCSSQKDIIRDKTVTVEVPKIKAPVIPAKPVNIPDEVQSVIEEQFTDSSYYQGAHVTEKGDSIKVKFYPKKKPVISTPGDTATGNFEIEVTPAPVEYTYTDTTHVVEERKSLSDYFIYIIVFAGLVLAIIIFIKRK